MSNEAQHSPRNTQISEGRLIYEQMTPTPEPLRLALGVFDDTCVPTDLHDWLISTANPEAEEVLTPKLYAVVDGARVPNLEQKVDELDDRAKCLFTGNIAEELGDNAPWLIQLEDGDRLLREMMSRGDKPIPWMMWENAPAIYIRSPLPFDDLWKHLRKFTALRDEAGRLMYFRFWDCRILSDFLIAHEHDGADAFFKDVSSVVVFHSRECARLSWEGPLTGRKFVVTEQSRARYQERRIMRQREAITDHLAALPDFSELPNATLKAQVDQHHASALQLGFTESKDIFQIVLGLCLCNDSPDKINWIQRTSCQPELTQHQKRREIEKRLHLEIDAAKSRQRVSA